MVYICSNKNILDLFSIFTYTSHSDLVQMLLLTATYAEPLRKKRTSHGDLGTKVTKLGHHAL